MNYQWYPGHMMKAKRMMQENMKLIDLVIELVDARIPLASRNPEIDELGKNKSRMILLNKSDLADSKWNKAWMEYFREKGIYAVEINSKSGNGVKSIQGAVQEVCKEKIERDRKRGIINRPVRAMVVGIPNVGKSTFINAFAGKACTKTGNKPGVTKGKQWIRLNKGLELLDTPGILWPKFEDQMVGMKLAFIGSINDEILHVDELALDLIGFLQINYPGILEKRYEITIDPESAAKNSSEDDIKDNSKTEERQLARERVEVLKSIAESRKCYSKGEELNLEKAAGIVIDDFRSGKLGRISLEFPEETNNE